VLAGLVVGVAAFEDGTVHADFDVGALTVFHDLGLVDDPAVVLRFFLELLDLAALGFALESLLNGGGEVLHLHRLLVAFVPENGGRAAQGQGPREQQNSCLIHGSLLSKTTAVIGCCPAPDDVRDTQED
jgi:hypothetical protein